MSQLVCVAGLASLRSHSAGPCRCVYSCRGVHSIVAGALNAADAALVTIGLHGRARGSGTLPQWAAVVRCGCGARRGGHHGGGRVRRVAHGHVARARGTVDAAVDVVEVLGGRLVCVRWLANECVQAARSRRHQQRVPLAACQRAGVNVAARHLLGRQHRHLWQRRQWRLALDRAPANIAEQAARCSAAPGRSCGLRVRQRREVATSFGAALGQLQ
mmetsp:Transcript_6570/g.19798  ORF Transcript_6570/g.19798 Transcript_6570/m.19798 type:complete len:216 (-) Transcript_6570:600-1247(-)